MPGEHRPGRQFASINGTFVAPVAEKPYVLCVDSDVDARRAIYNVFVYVGDAVRQRRVTLVLDSLSEHLWVRRVEKGKKYLAVQTPFSDEDILTHILSVDTVFDVFTLVSVLDKTAIAWLTESTDAS